MTPVYPILNIASLAMDFQQDLPVDNIETVQEVDSASDIQQ
jgi:hypothetical protein